MKGTVLNEEERLKKLVKDYFGDFVTARKTIEELEKALSDRTYFTEDGSLLLESVALFPLFYLANRINGVDDGESDRSSAGES